MSVNARNARLAVLAAWTFVFALVWLTGAADQFLGSRTEWVAPFGAISLALVTVAYALSLRVSRARVELTGAEATTLVVMLVPLGALLLVPNATLGSFAASQKANDAYFLRAAPPPPATPADVSFLDIRVAEGDRQFAAEAGIEPGLRVRLTGIVIGSKTRGATFELARFYVGCCVADAFPVGVPVAAGRLGRAAPEKDTWLQVTGKLRRRGGHFVVDADGIRRVAQPEHPYLSFSS
jgi:uncharacterized repeat protein (TIGR03943 family)